MKRTYLIAYAWPEGNGRAIIETEANILTEAGIEAMEAKLLADAPVLQDVAIQHIQELESTPAPSSREAEIKGLAARYAYFDRYAVLGTVEELTTLVDRARPVKPYKESMSDRLCNACGSHLSWDAMNDALRYAPKFCPDCGQALDWSGENG